ncbi:MAG: tetratricopeptide repeat protein [Paludibacteraceae bacterium]|nr:tetratricopeptide repeat protein [Paludibacteraceae bacterium]
MSKNKKSKYVTEPIAPNYTSPKESFFKQLRYGTSNKAQWIPVLGMFLFGLFCLIYFPITASDFAISGDEIIDDTQSSYVLNYFKTGDKTALEQPKTKLHLYGSEIQIVIKYLSDLFHIEDVYAFRHICCSLIAVWGICVAGLLGFRIGGGLCGLLTMILLFFTPRFFGHAMNNLKDLPFAVGYLVSNYYFIRFFDHYPKIKAGYLFGVLAGLFLCLGTRSGGLMLYPMLFMYAGLYYIRLYGIKEAFRIKKHFADFSKILLIVLLIFLSGYVISIILWPWALQDPLHAMTKSLKEFTNIGTSIKTIFEGKQMMSNMLPAAYAPKYLLIATPLVILTGLFGSLIYLGIKREKFSLDIFFILFCLFAPLCYVVYKHSNLYGGIRHLLFLFPLMAIMAGYFWSSMIQTSTKWLNILSLCLFIGLLALPIRHYAANHPYEYIYFNELTGGFKGAYGDYESDYYFNSLKASADFLKKNKEILQGKNVIIATNHSSIMQQYFRNYPNVKIIYSKYYEKYSKEWDYAAFSNVYISLFQQKNGLFPPENTILNETVDGKSVGCLIKRSDKDKLAEAFKGINTDKEKSIRIFEDYLQQHPNNEEVCCALVKIYYLLNDYEKVDFYAQKALKLMPNYNEVLFYLSYSQIKQKKFSVAEKNIALMLNENELSPDAIFLRANIKAAKKEYQNALKDLDYVINRKPKNVEAFILGMRILENLNEWDKVEFAGLTALKFHPNNVKVVTMISNAVCHQGRYDEAEQWLAKAMTIQPTYYEIYKVRARICLNRNDLQEAYNMLSMLTNLTTDSDLYLVRAIYYMQSGDSNSALQMAQQALATDADNMEAKLFINNLQ